jgi:hypothetical protein
LRRAQEARLTAQIFIFVAKIPRGEAEPCADLQRKLHEATGDGVVASAPPTLHSYDKA